MGECVVHHTSNAVKLRKQEHSIVPCFTLSHGVLCQSAEYNSHLHRTLLELVTDSIQVSIIILNGDLQVQLNNDAIVNASTTSSDNVWGHVVVTLENTTQTSLNVSFFVDSMQQDTSVELLDTFPTRLASVTAGSNFSGLLQDVGIYLPALSANGLNPEVADHVPQCLCYPNDIGMTDSCSTSICTGTMGENRYNYTPICKLVEIMTCSILKYTYDEWCSPVLVMQEALTMHAV